MDITSIPPKLLHRIFSNLPLPDLLKLHLIYPKWSSIQQSICSNQQSVTILVGTKAIDGINNSVFVIPYENHFQNHRHFPCLNHPQYENGATIENLLQFEWFDFESAVRLTKLLPNINELTISVRDIVPSKYAREKSWNHKSVITEQVAYLLENWTLESAKIYIRFKIPGFERTQEIQNHFHQLARSINRVRTLKHLTLELRSSLRLRSELRSAYSDNMKQPFDLSILSTIEEFYFDYDSPSPVDAICESLVKYGAKNQRLQKIGLVHDNLQKMFETEFYQKSSSEYQDELLSKVDLFQMIHFHHSISENLRMKFYLQFSHLRAVTIYLIENEKLDEIYGMLKSFEVLHELVYLKLFWRRNALAETIDSGYQNSKPIPCLPSVKILQICANIQTHTDLYSISWYLVLPNLEILNYDDDCFDCAICQIYNTALVEEQTGEALRRTCIRECLQPWKRCAKIREVYWGYCGDWSAEAWDMDELWYDEEGEVDLTDKEDENRENEENSNLNQ